MILPTSFTDRMKHLCGDGADAFFASLQKESPVSIRINRKKLQSDYFLKQVPWCDAGYYLPERLHFTFDPLFHGGGYYVQEASSMFLEQVIRQYVKEPVRCLDLCAAPGGKSTHLLSLLPEGSLLVSNEVIRNRSQILAENITKWGNPNVIVTNNDPEAIGELTHLFDVIVTDVPCSGEGMFRKDPNSIGEWSEANVDLCASRQRRIIHDVWNTLRPGGLLVYSTCTYNTKEDEENVAYIVEEFGAEIVSVNFPEEWGVSGGLTNSYPVCRFFPHLLQGEGFFIAVLRKPDDGTNDLRLPRSNNKKKGKIKEVVPDMVKQLLINPENFNIEMNSKGLHAFPIQHTEVYEYLCQNLHVILGGVIMGEIKGKDFIPSPGLAMSQVLCPDRFPQWEVEWEEAVRYLRKEPLIPEAGLPKGYLLVTYKGLPLGFVKNLGNRTNNLYPMEWRIRSGYLPELPRMLE